MATMEYYRVKLLQREHQTIRAHGGAKGGAMNFSEKIKEDITDLKEETPADSISVEKAPSITAVVSGCDLLNLRKGASSSADVIAFLENGNEVLIEEVLSDWLKVKTQDGLSGFCMKKYMTIK